ncbi:DUF302 family protein [Halanaeroarchaeum sp. HSR-CO]|uniref:DUF302 domain-containing protein n=1 Tax=Halanaeroarchaeum sp. HSR-CO TaxID=2866382 RepID=UPI00217EEB51|nr:DUF302 domain-containing protein [Halanaeroarchaeum sp. HSR-CO]UWG48785.1 DUF302 family protein [Halanaeroarchaeum sp. HSR-CO]
MDRNVIIVGIAGVLVGSLLTGAIGFYAMPSLMIQEDRSPHDFETTVELFEEEVSGTEWSLVTTHDLAATMDKHGHDVEQVKVFELCNAGHASEILAGSEERIVTPMMPCRVAIYEKADGNTYIARMNSGLVAKPFGGTVTDVMEDAAAETEVVIDAVLETPPDEASASLAVARPATV